MFPRKTPSLTPYSQRGEAAATMATPLASSSSSTIHNPFTQMLLNSGFMLGAKMTLCGAVCLSTAMLALDRSAHEIYKANLWLVSAAFCFVAGSAVWQLLALNLHTFKKLAHAWNELRVGADLDGDGVVGGMGLEGTSVVTERVVDLIPTNRDPVRSTIEAGKVAIDRRDFLAFLHRSWESNGVPEQGTSRLYWIGGKKKNGMLSPQYIFERSDGTRQLCTRELYDSIVGKLESIGELENRMPGASGTLKRDPALWVGAMKWL